MTVQAILDEIIAEVVSDLTATQMLSYFKSGLRRMPAYISSRMFLAEGTVTLAQGAYTVSLSSLSPTMTKERAVWYVGDNNARIPIVLPPSPGFFHDNFTPSGNGKPAFYRVYQNTMMFDKSADASTTIGLDYFKALSSIVLGDTFVGDELLIEAAKEFCKAKYYSEYEEDKVKASERRQEAFEIMEGIEADYQQQEHGSHVQQTTEF